MMEQQAGQQEQPAGAEGEQEGGWMHCPMCHGMGKLHQAHMWKGHMWRMGMPFMGIVPFLIGFCIGMMVGKSHRCC